jgi:N-acetylglutamate synthase-like GNAT family acetyltransferase
MQPTAEPARFFERKGGMDTEQSLSELLWDLDWRQHLPVTLTDDGIIVEAVSFEHAFEFIARHYAEIFDQIDGNAVFTGGNTSPRRARYYRKAGDFFAFRREERTIGLLACTPVDWSTYYLRSGALLPEYQDRKLMQRFVPLIFARLAAAGVERIHVETSPSNLRMMQLLTHLRFNVTGTMLTERWGALVHFTKFLDTDSEDVFLRQFCSGVKYQLKEREAGTRSDTWI